MHGNHALSVRTKHLRNVLGIEGAEMTHNAVCGKVVVLVKIVRFVAERSAQNCTLHRVSDAHQTTFEGGEKQPLFGKSKNVFARSQHALVVGKRKSVDIDVQQFFIFTHNCYVFLIRCEK